MKRTLDPTNLNRVCNHPEVRPWLGGEGELDVSIPVSNPLNFTFEIEGGGYILANLGNGNYEGHSQFVPEARRYTLKTLRETFDYMFTRTDCMIITTQIPDNNPAAASLAKKAGFKFLTRNENTPLGPSNFVLITIADWIANNPELEAGGKLFHDKSEEAKALQNVELPAHEDHPEHDRFVGAAIRMAERGNVRKAVSVYNQWANQAGFSLLHLITETPVMVECDGALVSFSIEGELEVRFHTVPINTGHDFEVIQCQQQ